MSDPMDQQKDQREQLRKKVKLLEEEIVQRTRNFMQSSRLRHKHSVKPNDKKCTQMGIQTDPAMATKQLINHSADESEWKQQLVNELRQFQQRIRQRFADLLDIGNENTQQKPKHKQSREFSQQLKIINNSVLQMISFVLETIKISKLTPQHQNPTPLKPIFKTTYIEALQNLSKQLNEYPQTTIKQIEELNTKLQKYSNNLRQTEVRCQFITKALNQSEQANYQLRLQIQDSEHRCRDSVGQLQHNQRKIQQFQVDNAKMKLKIQQMEVMKKEYLRAYSKIKQQKQSLHMKLLDLQQQLQNKIGKEKYFNINVDNYEIQASGSGSRLKTIEQHMMEDERREQIMRRTQSQNSLSAIKQIIEHGLMQTNRSTSQKWIKSALLKLENYEQNQIEEAQKNIRSQNIIETNIHDHYKSILNAITKTINSRKDRIQSQFNVVMDRIVGMSKEGEREGEEWGQKQEVKVVRQESNVEDDSGLDSSLNLSKSVDLEPKVYELVSKLNESYIKYEQLKKKYDLLLQKKQQAQPQPIPSQISPKTQQTFNRAITRIIGYQQKMLIKIKGNNTKYNEQFFDKLSHKIFEIVCNLPTISNQQMFFIPTNQEELQDALNLIYQFSLEFDKIQEARLKEFKNQAFGLTRVLEDIAVAKEVTADMVIKSMSHNLPEETTMSGDYVKTLIKKLSQEQPDKKPKSSKSIQIELKQKNP